MSRISSCSRAAESVLVGSRPIICFLQMTFPPRQTVTSGSHPDGLLPGWESAPLRLRPRFPAGEIWTVRPRLGRSSYPTWRSSSISGSGSRVGGKKVPEGGRTDWGSVCSDVVHCDEERAELWSKVWDLIVYCGSKLRLSNRLWGGTQSGV